MAMKRTILKDSVSDDQMLKGHEARKMALQKIAVILERQKSEPLLDDDLSHQVQTMVSENEDFRLGIREYAVKMRFARAVAATAELEEELLRLLRLEREFVSNNVDLLSLRSKLKGLENDIERRMVELESIKKLMELLIDDLAACVAKVCEKDLGVRVFMKGLDEARALVTYVCESRLAKNKQIIQVLEKKLKEKNKDRMIKVLGGVVAGGLSVTLTLLWLSWFCL